MYIILIVSVLCIAIYSSLRKTNASDAPEIVVTILAIIECVAFWLGYHHNSQVNADNTGVLRLAIINDFMAYRCFLAVNNPIVQKLRLDFLKAIFRGWAKKVRGKMPLEESEWKKVKEGQLEFGRTVAVPLV